MQNKYFIFDLDDTLTSEYEYLQSAYKNISDKLGGGTVLFENMISSYHRKSDVFDIVSRKYNVPKEQLLHWYRYDLPNITLKNGARDILDQIQLKGYKLGLITDGRSVTQRNKIKALAIGNYFAKIVISEEIGTTKPSPENYIAFDRDKAEKYYIADNPKKDFITPNRLGWQSVCLLDDGTNIHPQDFNLEAEYLPKFKISSLSALSQYL